MVACGGAVALFTGIPAPLAWITAGVGVVVWLYARGLGGVRLVTAGGTAGALLSLSGAALPSAGSRLPTDEDTTTADTVTVAPSPLATPVSRPTAPDPPAAPPMGVVEEAVHARLPAGFQLASALTPVGSPRAGEWAYRVAVRPPSGVYRVPVVPIRLPAGTLRTLHGRENDLVLDPSLPPGMMYDAEAAVAADEVSSETWRVRAGFDAGGWRVHSASRDDPGPSASARLLTDAELSAVRGRAAAALAAYSSRCERIDREAAELAARESAALPPRCSAASTALLGEVLDLAEKCAATTEQDARASCYARRDRLNREMGGCERQNLAFSRAKAAADTRVAAFRRTRQAELLRALRREADAHRSAPGAG